MEKQENNPYYVTSQSEGFEGERGSEEGSFPPSAKVAMELKNNIIDVIKQGLKDLPDSDGFVYKKGEIHFIEIKIENTCLFITKENIDSINLRHGVSATLL